MPTGNPERGRAFLIKIGDGGSPVELFTSIGGQRTLTFTINGEPVDVSDKNSDWRELMTGAALKSISIATEGVFKDTASEDLLREYALNQQLNNYQIVSQDGDVWEGAFLITQYEKTGEVGGAVEYSATFESSGEITFDEVT